MQDENQANQMEIEEVRSICEGYHIIKKLGYGTYAVVKLGQKGHEQVAIKFLKVKNEQERPKIIQKLKQEVHILELLNNHNHTGIVQLKYVSDNLTYIKKNGQIVNKIGMILELGEKSSMLSYLKELQKFDEQTSRFYFRQLMTVLVYMKKHNIFHLDLKPDNIVFDSDFNLKITDFGFSKQVQGLIKDFHGGSKPYMAPEIWDRIAYDGSKVDVFAAAQILYKMITGCFAFNNCQEQPYDLIKQNDYAQFWNIKNKQHQTLFPQGFPDDFKDLINKMFDPDFNRRITPEECLQHPWTMGLEANLYQIQEQFNNLQERINQQLEQQKEEYKRKKQKMRDYERAAQEMKNLLQQSQQSYKSGNSQKKNPIIDKKRQIMKKFKFTFENRVLKRGLPTKMIDEILIYDDPKNLFCSIIDHFDKCGKIINIHETKCKLNVNIMENDEEKQEMQIELKKLEGDKLRVEVLNLGDDYIKFNEEVQNLKQSIQQQRDEVHIQQQ
ncbi:unnamed protein product [Paramecium pentaurelia]|uniref:Protein kinase domain-containing protein n=1 Tax=Paramecium pentaurelia TaxID=43138 RepID=A0A8S1S942_9CILI|nr:unnamed protein product [Paramecium pentaurelia]